MISKLATPLAMASGGAIAAAILLSASPGAASPAATTTSRITACVDAKTRAMFLAAADGTCPTGQNVISWPALLDPALVTKLNATLAGSLTSVHSLTSQVATLSSELTADRKRIARLQAVYASQTKLSAKIKTLDEISQQTQKELQQAMDGDRGFMTTIANILKELTDTDSAIVSNLK